MEKGHIVETAQSSAIFKKPEHAYTRKLMRATPRPGVTLRELLPEEESKRPKAVAKVAEAKAPAKTVKGVETPLLVVEKLVKEYPRQGGASLTKIFARKPTPQPDMFRAVDGIQLPNRARRERRPG